MWRDLCVNVCWRILHAYHRQWDVGFCNGLLHDGFVLSDARFFLQCALYIQCEQASACAIKHAEIYKFILNGA